MPITSISMVALGVRSVSESATFYRDTIGFAIHHQSNEFAFLGAGAITLVLNGPLGKARDPLAGAVELILPVESVSSVRAALEGQGVRFVNATHEVMPGKWAATFADPDGHWLTLLGPA